jgi:hypothetical protein
VITNIEDARLQLVKALESIGWRATAKTNPVRNAGIAEVGHARRVLFQSYSSVVAEIAVTVWVSETDTKLGARKLYELVSPGTRSIWALLDSDEVPLTLGGEVSVSNIGPRELGQNTYLAADLIIPLKVSAPR